MITHTVVTIRINPFTLSVRICDESIFDTCLYRLNEIFYEILDIHCIFCIQFGHSESWKTPENFITRHALIIDQFGHKWHQKKIYVKGYKL